MGLQSSRRENAVLWTVAWHATDSTNPITPTIIPQEPSLHTESYPIWSSVAALVQPEHKNQENAHVCPVGWLAHSSAHVKVLNVVITSFQGRTMID